MQSRSLVKKLVGVVTLATTAAAVAASVVGLPLLVWSLWFGGIWTLWRYWIRRLPPAILGIFGLVWGIMMSAYLGWPLFWGVGIFAVVFAWSLGDGQWKSSMSRWWWGISGGVFWVVAWQILVRERDFLWFFLDLIWIFVWTSIGIIMGRRREKHE